MSESEFKKVPTLDAFVEAVEKNGGVSLKEIGEGRTLVVETQNSTYTINIIEPLTGKVTVHGGKSFPEQEECTLSGSTFGGSMLKMNWIGLGMNMEFHRGEKGVTTTSPVHKISIVAPSVPQGTIH